MDNADVPVPRHIKRICLIGLCFFPLLFSTTSDAAIQMGFVGGRSVDAIVRQWSPLLDYLTHEVGVPIEMVLREDYQGLVDALANHEVDLFEGGLFTHIMAVEQSGAEPLVGEIREGKDTYRSVFAVRSDDSAASLTDLRGKRLALTDELSASGFLIPRTMIARAGIADPNTFFRQIVLTGSHDLSIEALLEGAVDVIAVGNFFFSSLPPSVLKRIKIIATSDPIPTGPITIRNDFPRELRQKLRQAFLSFGERVPPNIRSITEIDRFFPQEESAFEDVRGTLLELKALPALNTAMPYRRIPTVFADRTGALKRQALLLMAGGFIVLLGLLFSSVAWAGRRASNAVGLAVAGIVAFLASIFTVIQFLALYATMETYAAQKLGDLKNLNLRAVAAIAGASSESLDKIIANAIADASVAWAHIFRNGEIIASDRPAEHGLSVISEIHAGTFDRSSPDTISVFDPIIMGGRKYATMQVGISFVPLRASLKNAVTLNYAVLAFALVAGFASARFARHRFARPMKELALAVTQMREGGEPGIRRTDADVREVASSIELLGRELAEKERLIELRAEEQSQEEETWDPEVTRELQKRLRDIEDAHDVFRHMRRTTVIGQSPAWLRTLRDAAIRARDREPVVIQGPTGSGKTGVAHAIHAIGPRGDKPFGEFNCAEFASGDPLIVLGKLFGYGASSGIAGIDPKGQRGVLEEYDGGTLFLDEAELLPLQAQQLLLLPLEGRPFNPAAGKGPPQTVNVRFLFATNQPLEELVHAGKMRIDLLRRIQARGVVRVPPLARRREDIEPLAAHFLARRNGSAPRKLSFAAGVIAALSRYGFDRYNVSELAGAVHQAFDNASFEEAPRIELAHLSPEILEAVEALPEALPPAPSGFDAEEERELAVLRLHGFNITRAEAELGYAAGSKTLTHHLRGIVYRSLDRVAWDGFAAAAEIAGQGADVATRDRLLEKIVDYIASARRHVDAGTAETLFAKLPQKYFPILERFLDALRQGIVQSA